MTEIISADAQENILQRFLMRVGVMQRISEEEERLTQPARDLSDAFFFLA